MTSQTPWNQQPSGQSPYGPPPPGQDGLHLSEQTIERPIVIPDRHYRQLAGPLSLHPDAPPKPMTAEELETPNSDPTVRIALLFGGLVAFPIFVAALCF